MKIFGLEIKLIPKHPKQIWKDAEQVIVPAFELAGTQYYCYQDITTMAYKRALLFNEFYERINQKCTTEYLRKYAEAQTKLSLEVENLFNVSAGKSLNLTPIFNVIQRKRFFDQNLKERLDDLAFDPETIYDLATVIFFDKNENAADYDRSYNEKKKAIFKQTPDFFLQMPVKTLIPSLQYVPMNLEQYSRIVEQINQLHWKEVTSTLSELEQGKSISNSISSDNMSHN